MAKYDTVYTPDTFTDGTNQVVHDTDLNKMSNGIKKAQETANQVGNDLEDLKAAIPVVPSNLGAFNDDVGYATKKELETLSVIVENGSITPEKTSFLQKVSVGRPNLFDGTYYNYYISGSSSYTITASSKAKMAIIPIKPSTMYTINRASTLVATSVLKIFTVTTLADNLTDQVIDGAVRSSITLTAENNAFRNAKVTTGASDSHMLIVVTNTADEEVDLQVLEGSYNNFVDGTTTYNPSGSINIYPKDETYSKEEINTKLGGLFYKEGSKMYITLGKATYTLENYIKESINVSVWRLTDLWIGGETEIFKTSDIEGPMKEVGAADFIGGYHGDELMLDVITIADGNVVDMSVQTIEKTTFNRLTVFITSMLNRCDTPDENVVKRYKVLDFSNEKLTIRNTYNILVDNFVINRLCGGGLISIYKDIVNYTSDNVTNMCRPTDNTTTSDSVLLSSNKFDDGTFYGDGFSIRIRSTGEKFETYTGKIQDYATESRPRLKIYFDSILSASGVTYNNGDSIATSFEIEIK